MAKRGMDKKFLDFPLCCLAYIRDDPQKLKTVAQFCVIDKALKMETDYELDARMNRTDFSFMTAENFDINQGMHKRYAIASMDLGVPLASIDKANNCWLKIKKFVDAYEQKYGKDAYCRMGRQLTFETIDGKFEMRNYLVLAAIHSILGKRNSFLRITYRRIAYCMTGFKKKEIAIKEIRNLKLLTDRQMGTCVEKLREKNLIRVFLYNHRERFYSTRIQNEETLRELVAKNKLKKAERRFHIEDQEMSQRIKSQIKKIKLTGKPNTMYLNTEVQM